MKQKAAQTILKNAGVYSGKIDGDFGPVSCDAAHKYYDFPNDWKADKLYIGVIQVACIRKEIPVGIIDGLWGNNTQSGYEKLLVDLKMKDAPVEVSQVVKLSTKYNDWPKQDYNSMVAFYGKVGENQTSLTLPYPMYLAWEPKTIITKITCHEKVKDSLERILKNTLDHYGLETIKQLHLDNYGGCLNVRKMRGGSSWSIHCLPENSPVWTPTGVKYIQDIRIGDLVYSYNDGILDAKPVKNVWKNGFKSIVKVSLNGAMIECSPEHKIMVLRKKTLSVDKWIKNLGTGHKRAIYTTEMIEAGSLQPKDKVIVVKGCNYNIGEIVWDDWYEILGMFIGDGCIHHKHGIPQYMSFQIPIQDRIRNHAETLLKRYFGEDNLKFDNKQILCYRKNIYEQFLPYNKKSYDKTIPSEIWAATTHQKLSFVRGYVYTDGCVLASKSNTILDRINTRYSFKCASLRLMEELKLLLNLLNFRNTKTLLEPARHHEILGVKCYRKNSYSFYSTDTLNILDLKHDITYFNIIKNSGSPNKGTSPCMGYEHIGPNFIYKVVKSVTYDKLQVPVFDIEVEDTHNFIVDGIVVSNSWGASIDLDPDRNQLKWGKDKAFFARDEYLPFWKIVEAEGWVSLGRSSNMDFMHMQAARL